VDAHAYDHLARRGIVVTREVLRDEARVVLRRYQDLGRPVY
jgi:hypothetical protein